MADSAKAKKRKVNVRFYRVSVLGSLSAGVDVATLFKLAKKDVAIAKRSYTTADNDFYIAECEPSALTDGKLRVLFAKRLVSASPHYLDKDNIKVAAIQDWMGPTYVVFFPTANVVGTIAAVEGPRPSAIALLMDHLFLTSGSKFNFAPIARPDVEVELQRLSLISKVSLRFSPADQPTIFESTPDLDTMMKSLAAAHTAATVTLTISANKKTGGLRALQQALTKLVKSHALKKTTQFTVDGTDLTTRRMRHVDLLEDEIVVQKTVEIQDGAKNLLSEAAFGAIEEAYAEIGASNFPSVSLAHEE